jgi:copper chaperone NosL
VSTVSRALAAVASLALLLVYAFPLWRIDLEAPQYPEGLGMHIWVNTVRGAEPNDLQNINGLNHYIGMKPIHPEAIPELQYMPWVVGVLAAAGLAVAVLGRRRALYAWAGLLLAASVAGLVDFYAWLHDYGHDLDPLAAIKVPGMSYQPPLVGSREILNFTAHSWPALGGWMAILAGALAAAAVVHEVVRGRRAVRRSAAAVLLLAAASCSPGPEPIAYGSDACAHCRMVISDERFGAELVTRRGRVDKFDSIECLAAALDARAGEEVHSLWVTDHADPPRLIEAREAVFVHSSAVRSPMGMNLAAFGAGSAPDSLLRRFPGRVLSWEQVRTLVRERGDPHVHGPAH